MMEQSQLDHAVINVGYEMDKAAEVFAALGFTLTERGYHTLGSINHLMMFGEDYLELIGLPTETANAPAGRPDIANVPYGLNGLVFKTDDAAETAAHLASVGMSITPPKSFSRPVKLADGEVNASFTTAHVTEGRFAGGRVYFCQHHTSDIVWRDEWQHHANGATAISEFVIVAEEATAEAQAVGQLLGTKSNGDTGAFAVALKGGGITILSPENYRTRYGALTCPMEGRSAIFGELQIRTDSLDKVRNIFRSPASEIQYQDMGDRLLIREPTFNALFEFVE